MKNTTAFVLAAGLGTRLRPLTADRPKALVLLDGKPLLARAIDYISQSGIGKIVINAHHFAPQIVDFVRDYQPLTAAELLISDESDLLLDTGGALQKAAPLLLCADTEQVLVYNADIYSNLDLVKFCQYQAQSQALSLLAVQKNRISSRSFVFDSNNVLVGWQNQAKNIQRWATISGKPAANNPQPAAFSGIHCLHRRAFELLPAQQTVFSVVDWYLQLAEAGKTILAYPHDQDDWFDVGKPEQLAAANQFLQIKR
jgi:NDP-sugar pyrophosphorylase family protein